MNNEPDDEDNNPLDSTPRDGGKTDEPDTGQQDPPRHGGDGVQTPAPATATGTPQDATDAPDDLDVDPVNGFHQFRGAAVPASGPAEHGIVLLTCADVARMSVGERAVLERSDVWPPLSSCATCSPQFPDEVPDSWLQ